MRIAAFDPGVTTGVATFNGQDYKCIQIIPGQHPHPHESLFDLLAELNPQEVVYEKFLFRQSQTGAVFRGVEYIGVIELFAQIRCIPCIGITPSQGKAFWNDRKIKALGLWVPGKPHAMDAMRVLLTHQMKTDSLFKDEVIEKLKDLL